MKIIFIIIGIIFSPIILLLILFVCGIDALMYNSVHQTNELLGEEEYVPFYKDSHKYYSVRNEYPDYSGL